ncbi:hypothetical protein CHU92_01330 [Flavobacterium cyanobacteriorum]|uniref:GLPGLI family protein n=1 Tax=Flavobacterium cyanobacteriorum TaxID=2022802 RepID=A0A255ZZ09_9FLAO|nr:GLPGLI family protein [Flavobacterium cyanobacteriorum]OYQ46787.1 hypothetical protein CHU92_01330 [Flavobacterium cyanobacteriorum]
MRKILFFLSFCFTSISNGQTMEVDYLVQINTNDADLQKEALYKLKVNNKNSLFYNITNLKDSYVHQERVIKVEQKKDVNVVWFENFKTDFIYNQQYFTDFTNDSIIFNSNVFTRKIIIKDTYKNLNWELSETSKDSIILGYKCQKATTKFRGRTYEAYFTPEIETNAGPWKFHGLPGLIMSVRSLDNYLIISATKYQLKKESSKISNPFKDDIVYTWPDYIKFTVKFLKQQLKVMQTTADVEEGSIKISEGIEDLGISKMSF